MDRFGIAAAVTSISTPGVWFGDVRQACRLARDCNEFAAQMAQDHPGRFGFFATLPMPDVDATLAEIAYAFDTLGADGVGMMSNYGRVWPGDPAFAPVFDELNRRKAVAYVDPILPEACAGIMPGIGESALEYPFDTARAIASLLYNGTLLRWPNVRFIFPHAGGAMPPLAERVGRMADRDRKLEPAPTTSARQEIRSLYFDVATSTNPVTMAGAAAGAGRPAHVRYGLSICRVNSLYARSFARLRTWRHRPSGDRMRHRAGAVSAPCPNRRSGNDGVAPEWPTDGESL